MVELLTRNTQASKYRCMCFSELLRLLTASIFDYSDNPCPFQLSPLRTVKTPSTRAKVKRSRIQYGLTAFCFAWSISPRPILRRFKTRSVQAAPIDGKTGNNNKRAVMRLSHATLTALPWSPGKCSLIQSFNSLRLLSVNPSASSGAEAMTMCLSQLK